MGWSDAYHLSPQTDYLNRGDGTCRHFDDNTKLCSIYQDRPLVCRVEEYYEKHLADLYKWNDFVKINLAICDKLP